MTSDIGAHDYNSNQSLCRCDDNDQDENDEGCGPGSQFHCRSTSSNLMTNCAKVLEGSSGSTATLDTVGDTASVSSSQTDFDDTFDITTDESFTNLSPPPPPPMFARAVASSWAPQVQLRHRDHRHGEIDALGFDCTAAIKSLDNNNSNGLDVEFGDFTNQNAKHSDDDFCNGDNLRVSVVRSLQLRKAKSLDSLVWMAVATMALILFSIYKYHGDYSSYILPKVDLESQRMIMMERQYILRQIRDSSIKQAALPEDKFTIKIMSTTAGRSDFLLQSLDAHAHCFSVKNIEVDAGAVSEEVLKHSSGKVVVGAGGDGAMANAVLLLDDDVVFTCDELERAFRVWSKNPERMVGFYPYTHEAAKNSNTLTLLKEVQRGQGEYSLTSDRAAFVHNAYLKTPKFESEDGVCKKLALSVRVTSISSQPPMVVAAEPLELRYSWSRTRYLNNLASRTPSCLEEVMRGLALSALPHETRTYFGVL